MSLREKFVAMQRAEKPRKHSGLCSEVERDERAQERAMEREDDERALEREADDTHHRQHSGQCSEVERDSLGVTCGHGLDVSHDECHLPPSPVLSHLPPSLLPRHLPSSHRSPVSSPLLIVPCNSRLSVAWSDDS